MSSLLCSPRSGGFVLVHSPQLLNTLLLEENDSSSFDNDQANLNYPQRVTAYMSTFKNPKEGKLIKNANGKQNHIHRQRPKSSSGAVKRRSPCRQIQRSKTWVEEKAFNKHLENKDKNTFDMYDTLLEQESELCKEQDDIIARHNLQQQRKRELLHKKWTDSVYSPVNSKVSETVNSPASSQVAAKKRDLYVQYLEYYNRKGHVFLETISPDEYCPTPIQPNRVNVYSPSLRSLHDPLSSRERSRNNEERILFQCENGSQLTNEELERLRKPTLPLVPLGRHGTQCTTWINMPQNNIESNVRLASSYDTSSHSSSLCSSQELQRRMRSTYNQSQIEFDRPYNVPAMTPDGVLYGTGLHSVSSNHSLLGGGGGVGSGAGSHLSQHGTHSPTPSPGSHMSLENAHSIGIQVDSAYFA